MYAYCIIFTNTYLYVKIFMYTQSSNIGGGEVFEDDSLESISDSFCVDERYLSLFDSGDAGDSPR
jgi:hypothetical protein